MVKMLDALLLMVMVMVFANDVARGVADGDSVAYDDVDGDGGGDGDGDGDGDGRTHLLLICCKFIVILGECIVPWRAITSQIFLCVASQITSFLVSSLH